MYNLYDFFSRVISPESEEQVYQQTEPFFYKFRYVFASLSTVAFLMLISALVTTIGHNTALDTKTHPSTSIADVGISPDTPNAVTAGGYALEQATQQAMLSTGRALYGVCQSMTTVTVRSGKSVAHGSAVLVGGVWNGIAFAGHGVALAGRGIGNGVLFTVRVPGEAVSAVVPSGHAVSSIIKPADDKSVPTINTATSAAIFANLSAQQQQQFNQLVSNQLAANQSLDGTVVAGDPTHGGYPAKWDTPIRQDSRLDSWGMYNRECVSYTAWKVYQTFGTMPYWGGRGNANEWPGDARRAGIPTGSTPQVHAVAISMHGYYGHAMWVEKVSGDMIYVSQYNYDLHGHYSEMWVNGSSFTYIYFK